MTMTLDGTNGVTFNDTSLQGAAASPYVLKNRIINGAMQVWQRGTSFASTAGYTTDRWSTVGYGSFNETVSQSTSVPTVTTGNAFQYSLKMQRPASSTGTSPVLIAQCIESNNCYDLSGQTVTFSFWAKAGANFSGTNLNAQVYTGTGADQGITSYTTWTGVAVPISGTLSLTTSWQRFTFTGTFGAGVLEAAVFIFYSPTGTAGADDSVFITGVQLEQNTVATPFERRMYTTEYQLCQRYLPATAAIGGSGEQGGQLLWISSTTGWGTFIPIVQPRVVPTGFTGTNTEITVRASASSNTVCSAVSYAGAGLSQFLFNVTIGSAAGVANASGFWYLNTTGAKVLWTGCEL